MDFIILKLWPVRYFEKLLNIYQSQRRNFEYLGFLSLHLKRYPQQYSARISFFLHKSCPSSTIQLLLFTYIRLLSWFGISQSSLLRNLLHSPHHPSQFNLFFGPQVVQHEMLSHPTPIEKLRQASNSSCSIRSNKELITIFFITTSMLLIWL